MRLVALLLLLLANVNVVAVGVERVLLPITVLDVPGAHGSLWRSELWAHVYATGVVILPLRIADYQPVPVGTQLVPVFLRHRDRKSTRLNSVTVKSRMPSSA